MRDTRLFREDLSGPADRLRIIADVGRAISSTLDLYELYDTIHEHVGRVMDTTLFFIALQRPERGTVELSYLREGGTLRPAIDMPVGRSVTSLVIDRGTSLLFNTLGEYQEYGRENGLEDITVGEQDPEAMIFVPLNTGNRTIGGLSVQSLEPNAYTRDDVQTLTVIASQAAVAIENASLYLQSEHNVRRTQALLRVAQMINRSLDLQTVLDTILEGMRDVMPYYFAAILMPDGSNECLEIMGAIGPMDETTRRAVRIPFGIGVTGKVFVTGDPLNIPDVCECADYLPNGLPEIRSEMVVPLKRGDTVIGVLDVERTKVQAFPSEDVDLMMLFASQAAIAIENARLFSEQRSRVVELQTIQTLVQRITPLHDIPSIAGAIEGELRVLIRYHACHMYLMDPNGNLAPISPPGSAHDESQAQLGEQLCIWIAQHGEPALVRNTCDDPRATDVGAVQAQSLIGVPLMHEDRVRGVVILSKPGANQFDENALRLLEIIAAQAAIAFDRARLYDELRTEAITDPVTKLYNRRYLHERFREERARATRNKHNLTAIMIDIDKFKRVNDSFGHDAGDCVLQELARVVRSAVRTEDIVARYGGEEFCILLPEISAQDAATMAERLRIAVEAHEMPHDAGVPHISVSVGVAVMSGHDESTEVFTRADQAMYFVKHRGGNRVCVDTGSGGSYYCAGDGR